MCTLFGLILVLSEANFREACSLLVQIGIEQYLFCKLQDKVMLQPNLVLEEESDSFGGNKNLMLFLFQSFSQLGT